MKHKKKFLPCILACALVAMPLAACNLESEIYDDKPDAEIEYPEGSMPGDTPDVDQSVPDDRPDTPVSPPLSGEVGDSNSNNNEPGSDTGSDSTTTAPKPDDVPTTKSVSYICTKVNGLNIRSGPSTSYSSLGAAESGVLLKLVEKVGNFYKTSYLNRTAYVSANPSYTSIISFELADANDDIERVIEDGLKVLGTEYVYGAARYHYGNGTRNPNFTVTEFDCSSLMQYIFYKGANALLDMTSRTQSLQGRAINRSEIKRGDLLFFTNSTRYHNTGIERIGHVALYLGKNYILHTASDYAKIEQISSARWSYYISARRIIE